MEADARSYMSHLFSIIIVIDISTKVCRGSSGMPTTENKCIYMRYCFLNAVFFKSPESSVEMDLWSLADAAFIYIHITVHWPVFFILLNLILYEALGKNSTLDNNLIIFLTLPTTDNPVSID